MRIQRVSAAALCVATLIVGGCTSSGATPSLGPTPTPTATPTSTPTASPSSVASGFYLRFWVVAPVGPEGPFWAIPLVISDGQLLTVEHSVGESVPIYRQPVSQPVSEAGLAMIVAEAQAGGLLGSTTEFICPHAPGSGELAGTGTYHLLMVVGGASHEMSGSCMYERPTAPPGTPAPGTWFAFEEFRSHLENYSSWLGDELGEQTEYEPQSLAVLVQLFTLEPGEATPDPANLVTWPLGPLASFGSGDAEMRCAVVTGSDMDTLLPVLQAANTDSFFTDSGGALATVTVRAYWPGESGICASL